MTDAPMTGLEYFHAVVSAPASGETTCPVCGLGNAFTEPDSWEICERCDWEDDPAQRQYPDSAWGANGVSLNDARAEWAKR